jgi:hypothetical protein
MNPGDRVEGLANFGKPTGEFPTVERTNQDDAVVKWDGDGRTRLHQPWLKKVQQIGSLPPQNSRFAEDAPPLELRESLLPCRSSHRVCLLQ